MAMKCPGCGEFLEGIEGAYCEKCIDAAKVRLKKQAEEQEAGLEDCCSCHINPPCNYCLSKTEDEWDE